MNTQAFEHNFKTAYGSIDVAAMHGYRSALTHVLNYLAEVTEWNPNKRFIDAVPLLEKIEATANELTKLLQEEKENLQIKLTETDIHLLTQNFLS